MADTLQSKTDAVVTLEAQVEALQSALQTAHAEVKLKSSITSELENVKNMVQAQMENVQSKLKDQQEGNELLQTEVRPIKLMYILVVTNLPSTAGGCENYFSSTTRARQ
jgi:chromosome segregation ATPase